MSLLCYSYMFWVLETFCLRWCLLFHTACGPMCRLKSVIYLQAISLKRLHHLQLPAIHERNLPGAWISEIFRTDMLDNMKVWSFVVHVLCRYALWTCKPSDYFATDEYNSLAVTCVWRVRLLNVNIAALSFQSISVRQSEPLTNVLKWMNSLDNETSLKISNIRRPTNNAPVL